jgi:hypothetical protein
VTSWDVPSWSLSLTSNRTQTRPHVICFSEIGIPPLCAIMRI